jgi:hypothetical protein
VLQELLLAKVQVVAQYVILKKMSALDALPQQQRVSPPPTVPLEPIATPQNKQLKELTVLRLLALPIQQLVLPGNLVTLRVLESAKISHALLRTP